MSSVLSVSVHDFLVSAAAKTPTPGGGSVAALGGALAAALGAMAMEFTVGKKAYAAHEAETRAALAAFKSAGENLRELVAEDIAAYEALAPLLKLPADRRAANPDYLAAVVAAIRVPETILGFALSVLERCAAMAEKTNKFLIGDLGVAAAYAHATVEGAELMVRTNLPLLPNQEEAAAVRKNMGELTAKADAVYVAFRGALRRRMDGVGA
jgi:formiminotetrahydrofolate cyclodeaminase